MWIDDFYKLYFAEERDEEKIKNALKLKNENTPLSLFTYKKINEHTLELLKTDYLYLSTADKFNDPFESKIIHDIEKNINFIIKKKFELFESNLKYEFNQKEIKIIKNAKNPKKELIKIICSNKENNEYSEKKLNEEINQIGKKDIENINEIIINTNKMSCFSEIKYNAEMWNKYADNSKGICIEYDLITIDNKIKEIIYPINYTSTIDNKQMLNRIYKKSEYSLDFFLYKSKKYEYEKEWRLLLTEDKIIEGSIKNINYIKFAKPRAVYLGLNFKKNEELIKICEKRNIDIHQITPEDLEKKEYKKTEHTLIKEIEIKDFNHLINIIKGNDDNYPDLHQQYIFRGVGDINYKLIPSSLRKNNNKEYTINDYIDPEIQISVAFDRDKLLDLELITYGEYKQYDPNSIYLDIYDKNYKHVKEINNIIDNETALYTNQTQFIKENHVLTKFIDYSDKANLNVPINIDIRQKIHIEYNEAIKKYKKWPTEDYFEIIALAQHYGIPTCALDWSYDYKNSLYFAVINILKENNNDCVLWAFNYKKFEKFNKNHEIPIYCYRPQYVTNENLSAQKGLLMIWQNKIRSDIDFRSLETKLIEKMDKYKEKNEKNEEIYNNNNITFSSNEKLFYKFIIPGKLKLKILNELYKENISEEFLFPGYAGVIESIKNKVKLDEMKN